MKEFIFSPRAGFISHSQYCSVSLNLCLRFCYCPSARECAGPVPVSAILVPVSMLIHRKASLAVKGSRLLVLGARREQGMEIVGAGSESSPVRALVEGRL